MAIIEIELAIQHVKADDEAVEDPLFALYLDSALSICQGYCNRNFYEDDVTRYQAFDEGLVELTACREEWDAVVATSPTWDLLDAYSERYNEKRGQALRKVNGCVADGAVKAAILMTFGHLYRNRQDVVVGNMTASQLPVGAQRILQPYLHIGDLAGNAGDS